MKLKLPESIRSLSDEKWLSLLVNSINTPIIDSIEFPGFPTREIQTEFVGSANEISLNEAFKFYKLVKESAVKVNNPLRRAGRFLDFGCGWGRFLRFFWKDIDEVNMFGSDVSKSIVDTCHSLNIPGQIDHCTPRGSLPYPDSYFDTIIAYSVFTHLPENIHLHWMQELARVAKPGCVFCLTIQPRRFIDFIKDIPLDTNVRWYKLLSVHKPRVAEFYQIYDSGDFVFIPTNKGFEDTYGDAVIPLSFIKQKWFPSFEVHNFIDDLQQFHQAVLVMQRSIC